MDVSDIMYILTFFGVSDAGDGDGDGDTDTADLLLALSQFGRSCFCSTSLVNANFQIFI
eukprot:COSAG01_NODE_19422_length_1010_cov_1.296378_1_plen_59_part_00